MTRDRARLGDVETVTTHEECRRPPDQTPTPKRTHAAGHDHMERGLLAPQKPQGVHQRRLTFAPDRIEPSPLGFTYRKEDEYTQQQTGRSEGEKSCAPPERLGDGTGQVSAHP